jgi:bacillithiol biosynthesis deacetylase BshB1
VKVDILAIGVHPDDIELSCAGTLIKHIAMGYSCGLVDLTKGELGTRGSAELRLKEAEEGRKIIGALFRENLGMRDGFFEINEENIIKIATVIRRCQPSIILANAIEDRHPDHGRAAKLIADAAFYSGLLKIEIKDVEGKNLPPHRPKVIYHYIQDRNLKADFVVDITPYMDQKIKSVLAYGSQFKAVDGVQTPISSQTFYDFLFAKARAYGRDINVDFAEAFNVRKDIGVKNLFDLD